VALWSAVLQRVPGSRLLLKARQLVDQGVRDRITGEFVAHGIAADRLDLRGQTKDRADHLALYGEVDIALDTIPRTGGTTTAEALWMGVPVVSLAGDRFIERLSATMLNSVGLDELIAGSREEYVETAAALAGDDDRRREWRRTLRGCVAASLLCDGRGLAAALEDAYRAMWRRYLGSDAD